MLDVVVVSYNSRDQLHDCVAPLSAWSECRVIVVDNASADGSLDAVASLNVKRISLRSNVGFGAGCNIGWRAGSGESVLFLNPDARIGPEAVERLCAVLKEHVEAGAVGPRIVREDGRLEFSQRRFPRTASVFGQALFIHRIVPRAGWADEVIRDAVNYRQASEVDWLSGACLLVRRSVLEALGGFDEGFFLYCEDKDLCHRIWDAGYVVRYEPGAVCVHAGGASSPRSGLLPILAASRIRYARKHERPAVALVHRAGIAIGAASHAIAARGGRDTRSGHARSIRVALPRLPNAAREHD